MFKINLRYILSVFLIFLFGISFLSSDLTIPILKKWKANQLLELSKVYQDESITNESNLLDDGVRKARIANLLAPYNSEIEENFLSLLFRSQPIEALKKWASINAQNKTPDEEKKAKLLKLSIQTLKNDLIATHHRKIAGEIAVGQLNALLSIDGWLQSPDNSLTASELLAETGNPTKAKEIIIETLKNHPKHAESIFFLTRLIVHLKDKGNLPLVGKKLAEIAARKTTSGIEAIRHMTLLHTINPLSQSSLLRCIELLRINPNAKSIDFMRIYALKYLSTGDTNEKELIINSCYELFDLTQGEDLLIFSRWLSRIGAFNHLVKYLPASKAKIEEELFKLRMNALAQIDELETIHFEVNNAPIIPERWRLVIKSRAFALEGNFKESIKVLDRLLPILGSDPRLVRAICEYLESVKDIKGLTHILNKLISQPIHQRYSLRKLIQYRSASASLEELTGWMVKLSKLNGNDEFFSETYLYFELLDPFLASPSQKLDSLIDEAKQNLKLRDSPQTRITLALAQLRNRSPDKALVALGSINDWRIWQNTRPAWTFISSQIYELNHDTEKAMILHKSIDFTKFDRAEKESLIQLFPQSFPSIQ